MQRVGDRQTLWATAGRFWLARTLTQRLRLVGCVSPDFPVGRGGSRPLCQSLHVTEETKSEVSPLCYVQSSFYSSSHLKDLLRAPSGLSSIRRIEL